MGTRNYLVEGHSGTGKTSVATALEALGEEVIHGDRVLAYHGDPVTGERLLADPGASLQWVHDRWIWPLEDVRRQMEDRSAPRSFFCGGARNLAGLHGAFDAVFVLQANPGTLEARLSRRPPGEFGAAEAERAFVLQLPPQPFPEDAVRIEGSQSIEDVVRAILQHCAKIEAG